MWTKDKTQWETWTQHLRKWCINTDFTSRFKIISYVDSGSMGEVFKAEKRSSGETVAVKSFKRNLIRSRKPFRDALQQEIRALDALARGNSTAIKLFEIHESESHLFLVMEFLAGGNLAQLIKKKGYFSENTITRIMKSLLRQMSELHRKGLIHRDIKPRNVLIETAQERDEYAMKLIDFGLSIFAQSPGSLTSEQI